MTINELYFPVAGRKLYGRGLTMTVAGLATIAVGAGGLALITWKWTNALPLLGAAFVTALGIGLTLLVWFMYVYGTIVAWRDWRQLRPPAVLIDAAGVHYLAARSALVPWPDIERVCLHRTILPRTVISTIYLRLKPDAALIRDGKVKVPAVRNLNVGLLSDIDIPEYEAVQFLIRTAGGPLELEEIDRRPEAREANPA